MSGVHLVVLQHGLWGFAGNLGFLVGLIEEAGEGKGVASGWRSWQQGAAADSALHEELTPT